MKRMTVASLLLCAVLVTPAQAAFDNGNNRQSFLLTLQSLGLSPTEFEGLWKNNMCSPELKMDVADDVPDRVPLTRTLIKQQFLQTRESGKSGYVTLVAGTRCQQLNAYYFDGVSNHSGALADFFAKDKAFKQKFGFSAIDGIFAQTADSYATNALKHDPYKMRKLRKMQQNGLITLKETDATISGQSFSNYTATLTPKGRAFAEKLRY
ncbi:MAG: hypothetical protein KZQ58_10510 [gamma proteobacterium symbiont of Bathyaustriella thionipta]|nr:hypothetical protein [gamma proteobacterium symbiont of Bathyaustriella thionipta]